MLPLPPSPHRWVLCVLCGQSPRLSLSAFQRFSLFFALSAFFRGQSFRKVFPQKSTKSSKKQPDPRPETGSFFVSSVFLCGQFSGGFIHKACQAVGMEHKELIETAGGPRPPQVHPVGESGRSGASYWHTTFFTHDTSSWGSPLCPPPPTDYRRLTTDLFLRLSPPPLAPSLCSLRSLWPISPAVPFSLSVLSA